MKKGTHISDNTIEENQLGKYHSPNFQNPNEQPAKSNYRSHILTREEVENMKKEIGVRDMDKNYNRIIDGHGTGLAPPTEEEWEWMIGRIEVVDGLNGQSIPRIPKESDNSGLNDDIEVTQSVNDATPMREGTKVTSNIRGTGLSVGQTSRGIGVGLPTSVDHSSSNYFPTVGDQGMQGSCAAWATTYYAQGFMQAKDNGWNKAHLGNSTQLMSPAWTYNKLNYGMDKGSNLLYYASILCQFGSPIWAKFPYDDSNYTNWGNEGAWRDSPKYRIADAQITEPHKIDVVKSWLNDGSLPAISLDVANSSSNLLSNVWLGSGDDTVTSVEYFENRSDGGGHALSVVGYDDQKLVDGEIGAFKIVNSWSSNWGAQWGGNGFFWMTYRAFSEMGGSKPMRFLDRADYEPELLATWKFSTPGARDTNITIGIGNPNAPLEKIDLQYAGGNHSFPAFMCVDISNLTGHLGLADFYLDIDVGSSNSRVSSFKLELYGNHYSINESIRKSNKSFDVPFNTPGTAYNDIFDLHVNITSPSKHEYVGNGNVKMKGNSSISVTETILEESFEGSFPGDWIVGDSNASSGQDYWSNSSVKASNGSWSGYCAGYKEPVYFEDFNHGGNLPQGWITQSDGPDNYPWFSHNDDVPYLYGTDDYGIVASSYGAGPGKDITEWIYMSQSFDATDFTSLQLNFQIAFLDYDGDEFLEVLYANGSSYPTFNSLGYWTTSTYGQKSINLSSAAGESDVYLAFKYHGTYDNYVIIDDVIVTSDISGKYEVGMDSYMYMNVSLSNYDYVNLTYDFWLDCENQFDALYLIYFSGGNWHYVNGITGNWQNSWWYTWYNLPTTATKVGFYFYSDSSVVLEGAYIDNILLTGYVNRTKVDVKVDDGGWYSDIGTSDNWAVSIDTSHYQDGNHTISVRSYYGQQRYSYTSTYMNFDNTPPQINTWSNSTAQMGHVLYIETSVDDNVRMGNVYLNYSLNDGRYNNISLEKGSGNTWMKNITLPVNAVKMNLYFWAEDFLCNSNISLNYTILPDDPYLPEIYEDRSDNPGYTGNEFLFQVAVRDNVAVDDVWVEYWYGTNEHNNLSLDFNGYHEGTISVPFDSTEELHYVIWAMDTYQNIASSSVISVPIIDDDKPKLGIDLSSKTALTGDKFTFRINVTDNIDIEDVTLEYWLEGRNPVNVTMLRTFDFTYEYLIPLDFNGSIYYFFSVCDYTHNWNSSEFFSREVLDNDRPNILEDKSPQQGTTGDEYRFCVEPMDNIGVERVNVEYWFENGEKLNVSMNNEDSDFVLKIRIPLNTLGPMHYFYHMWDTSSNSNKTQIINVTIIDNDPPEAISQGDIYIDQNENALFNAQKSTDNLMITNHSWVFDYNDKTMTLYDQNPGFIFKIVGNYMVKLIVRDEAGNNNFTYFNVTVRDITPPDAHSEAPSMVLISEQFTLDGSASYDNVDIINYTWSVSIKGKMMEYYGITTSIIINDPGNYSFTLIVLDEEGNIGQSDFYILVKGSEEDDDDISDDDNDDNDDTDDDTDDNDDDNDDNDDTDDDTDDDDNGKENDDKPLNENNDDGESGEFNFGSSAFVISSAIGGLLIVIIIILLLIIVRKKKNVGTKEMEKTESDIDAPNGQPPRNIDKETQIDIKEDEEIIKKTDEESRLTNTIHIENEIDIEVKNEKNDTPPPMKKKEPGENKPELKYDDHKEADIINQSLLTPIISEETSKPPIKKKVSMKKRIEVNKGETSVNGKGDDGDRADFDKWDM